jgi:hypothetical protein
MAQTTERKVKGSLVVDMVKIIRAIPQLPWDKHLKPEDMAVVNSMVLPTAWYDMESYMRIGLAVYALGAQGKPENVVAFGRQAMQALFDGPYRPFLDKNDPALAIQKFLDLRKSLFTFSKMKMDKLADKKVRVTISELGRIEDGLEVFNLILEVHFVRLIELNGGKNVRCERKEQITPYDATLIFDLAWD